ncbi:MAG TPA: SDR family NAD(P)-dependent oxidoreductase, partial [Polyangiaceae bacterium]|nr:SDR family NAD(P)-dependent oxidoreductase [Polyangiaceae bacterium]
LDLRGKVVVVTGGGRGLGFAIANEFARRGSRLALCGRDELEVACAADELRRRGAEVFFAACDVSEGPAVRDFLVQVRARLGPIDVLINNAAECFVGPAVMLREAEVERALRNIFWASYHPTMAVLPQMRARRRGRIVHVTSIGGKVGLPHMAAYAAGKFAVTGFSETLAAELVKEGIYVSTVTPPPLRNGAQLASHFGGQREQEFAWFAWGLSSRLSAIDPRRAARAVVDAAEYGDPERAVSPLSWLLARFQGMMPNTATRTLALVDRVMPAPPPQPTAWLSGADVQAGSGEPALHALGETARAHAARYRPLGV